MYVNTKQVFKLHRRFFFQRAKTASTLLVQAKTDKTFCTETLNKSLNFFFYFINL